MYKYFYLKIDLKMIKYKKIVSFYDFFINIFIYKYNLIFKRIYVVLNYNKYKNIGIRNKFNNIKNIVYNLIILYGLGISVLYINILIKTSVIISNNIDIYNKKLKEEKTIFVIFFLIYLDLKSYFNEKIYSANTINSNNTIANNLSKKNGFTENYIKQVLEMVRHQPQKI